MRSARSRHRRAWSTATAPRRRPSSRSPRGDPQLLAPVAPGLDVLGVEVLHAARAEGALDADDVLDRRTRIGLVPAIAREPSPVVQALIAEARQASAV